MPRSHDLVARRIVVKRADSSSRRGGEELVSSRAPATPGPYRTEGGGKLRPYTLGFRAATRAGRSVAALLLAMGLSAAAPGPVPAAPGEGATLSSTEGYGLVRDLMSDERSRRRRAAGRLIEAGDETLVPALVDALFFIPRKDRELALNVLESLTGERLGSRYLDWVELVGSRTELRPKEGYAGWKGSLLERIDHRYGRLVDSDAPARIRLEEVVWGGVRLEGIPALDRPRHVGARDADFMLDDEIVFGVSGGGEHRAYPRRVLSWHEMANDVVGGEPLTLSFCTLCDSAVVYSGRLASGQVLTFGTSGLLYRSNKLMVDRSTGTLWSNLTGEAVLGPLAGEDPPPTLEVLPVTVTTWAAWRQRHPETTVMAVDRTRAERWGFDYSPGAADRARRGVSFPVWRKSDRLEPKAEVFALRLGGVPKAYPVEAVLAEGVVNDAVGGEPVVLVAEPESGAIRAYRRGGHRFRRGPEGAEGSVLDRDGRRWRLSEESLEPPPGAEGSESLRRVPGHQSFWFGWYGFYPSTELYAPE
ncbi:MAG: DUF3179 domain-containing protein [Thermoanaerobaculia bacterium]